jgi:hypothetical protein
MQQGHLSHQKHGAFRSNRCPEYPEYEKCVPLQFQVQNFLQRVVTGTHTMQSIYVSLQGQALVCQGVGENLTHMLGSVDRCSPFICTRTIVRSQGAQGASTDKNECTKCGSDGEPGNGDKSKPWWLTVALNLERLYILLSAKTTNQKGLCGKPKAKNDLNKAPRPQ